MLQCGLFRSNFAFAIVRLRYPVWPARPTIGAWANVTTPTPSGPRGGAGDGNRTRTTSLEGWGSTIELHPRSTRHRGRERRDTGAAGEYGGGWIRTNVGAS